MTEATAHFIAQPDVLATQVVLIETRHLRIPTGIRPFLLPNGKLTPTDLPAVLIRLADGDGVQGFSLLWFQQPTQALVVEEALRCLCSDMPNHALDDLDGIDRSIASAVAFLGAQGVNAFAASGLKMAVEDLVCRRRGKSLADLLGRRRNLVPTYQTGLMLHATIDELVEEAAAIATTGVRAVKMLVGKPTLDEDVDRIQAVRGTLPASASLMVDALQRWDSAATALLAAQRFADFDLRWIEDPLPHDDHAGYKDLARRSPIPIATGETAFARDEFHRFLRDGVRYLVGEPERVGGLRAWVDLAEDVYRAGAAMLPHLYPHVSTQLLATLRQEEVWLEYVPWFNTLAVEELSLRGDGTIEVGSSPGSGFTPGEDALERHAIGPWRRLND
ncbi:mandelate racemase/muconate lactonizing enzyme family protein [Mycolicibacterium stellerae]|uniref:mandelate racemase/muconate lactonizing enzyme family protein n=1 Tax=Mycolicibacterium stellerae TaxID=2358193 RepID=UPI0013DDBF9C|nr:enolase C-terminal domain-like protein [Mycolicibacterium stellerae]